jgi:hypothetical protein
MKKLVASLMVSLVMVISAQAGAWSFISSKISGGGTAPSVDKEVEAHGWDFRQYTWIDPAGRVCTIVFTDQKGGALDCDFPSKDFDYKEFYNQTK